MKLHALRDFVAVAERGSQRSAARHLGLSQSAISRSIQELERELGAPLFERHANGVQLTAMGEAFFRRAALVRKELERAKEEMAQLRGETHGRLTVCLAGVPHVALLSRALRPFHARYPAVRLEVLESLFPRVQRSLMDGSVDAYIGPVPDELPPEIGAEPLFQHDRLVVGRMGHPLAGARSLHELVGAEWITASITACSEDDVSQLFASQGLPAPHIAMHAHSALSFVVALQGSDFLMMLPRPWLEHTPWRHGLQPIRMAERLSARPVQLVRRTSLPLTPAGEYFCDLMRRYSAHVVGLPLEAHAMAALAAA